MFFGSMLMVVGAFACLVGMIPAGAVYYLAMAIVYTRLSGTHPLATQPSGATGGYGPPVGGYAGYGGGPPYPGGG
jgi:hypothetical protein